MIDVEIVLCIECDDDIPTVFLGILYSEDTAFSLYLCPLCNTPHLFSEPLT